jgi:TrmH family RNA methyltransferase
MKTDQLKTIGSRDNAEIKKVCALKQSKYRNQEQEFIAEGVRVCSGLIAQGHLPLALYVTPAMVSEARKLVDDHFIVQVYPHIMEKISSATTPSGMLGVFAIPPTPTADRLTAGIVLAGIADPGNMGTLIRSAAACGVESVIIIDGADVWSPKVVQATAGAIGAVKIFNWSWEQLIAHKGNKKLHALVVDAGENIDTVAPDNALLIVGNEAHGIPATWLTQCDTLNNLPMSNATESLNAAIAGSIAMYITFVQK